MIQKVIHYCWFGDKELPEREKYCLKTWKKVLPDYQIKLWNESNSDLSECEYVKQAYEKKYYAFVSDYIRIKMLYQYGGIYLDTDVEVLNKFDHLLNEKAFLGFENRTTIGTAVMACEKGADFAKTMVDYYQSHTFIEKHGSLNLTTNVILLNSILESKGLERVNKPQIVDGIKILERSILFPKKISDENVLLNKETLTIHHMSGSWLTERQKRRGTNKVWLTVVRPVLQHCQNRIRLILGENITRKIELYIRNLLK